MAYVAPSRAYKTFYTIRKTSTDTMIEVSVAGVLKQFAVLNSSGSYDSYIGTIVKPWLKEDQITMLVITEDGYSTVFESTTGLQNQRAVVYAADGSYAAKHGSSLKTAKDANVGSWTIE